MLWLAGQSESGEIIHQFRYKPCGSKRCEWCWPHWRDERIQRISRVMSSCPYLPLSSLSIGQIRTSPQPHPESLKRALRRAEVSWVSVPLRGGGMAFVAGAGWQRPGWDVVEDLEKHLKRLFYQHDRDRYLSASADMDLGGRNRKKSGMHLIATHSTHTFNLEDLFAELQVRGVQVKWHGVDTLIIKDSSKQALEDIVGQW